MGNTSPKASATTDAAAPVKKVESYFLPDPEKQTFKLVDKDENDWFELELLEKIQINHDTYKFSFKLPAEDHVIGLPVGGHMFFHFKDSNGEVVSRKYTPVSLVNERGKVTFVIKLYLPCDEFPRGGQMSQHLSKMNVGEKILIEGPKGLLNYEGQGNFTLKNKPLLKKKIGFIAGGSGITPCYQIIQASSLGQDQIPIVLLYSNKTKNDILVQTELEGFAKSNSNFKVVHTLTRHADSEGVWTGLKGRISEDLVK